MNRELAIKILKELAINSFEHYVNELKCNEEEATALSMKLYNLICCFRMFRKSFVFRFYPRMRSCVCV